MKLDLIDALLLEDGPDEDDGIAEVVAAMMAG